MKGSVRKGLFPFGRGPQGGRPAAPFFQAPPVALGTSCSSWPPSALLGGWQAQPTVLLHLPGVARAAMQGILGNCVQNARWTVMLIGF